MSLAVTECIATARLYAKVSEGRPSRAPETGDFGVRIKHPASSGCAAESYALHCDMTTVAFWVVNKAAVPVPDPSVALSCGILYAIFRSPFFLDSI